MSKVDFGIQLLGFVDQNELWMQSGSEELGSITFEISILIFPGGSWLW